jgi:hypothetical protein
LTFRAGAPAEVEIERVSTAFLSIGGSISEALLDIFDKFALGIPSSIRCFVVVVVALLLMDLSR